ncbi:Pvc16 family protein [Actinoplanes sp. NPDC048988]|uniref:Pvc16 family protein n=1 Tax=Actinoplanes sp. NPDC048988 TaxID=3363901 RepID=UPI0037246242
MTAEAIFDVTAVLGARLAAAVGGPVYVGPPNAEDVGERTLCLFLFHIVVNQAMRNDPHYVARSADPGEPLAEADALPLDLRFLLSVFRSAGAGNGGVADPDELLTLGRAVRALHERPFVELPGQYARVTPEPYPMEEMSRVWGLFPQTSYRTSMVYLVSPVAVTAVPVTAGAPVVHRTDRPGRLLDAPVES